MAAHDLLQGWHMPKVVIVMGGGMVGWSGPPSNIHFWVLRGWMDGHAARRGGDLPPRHYEHLWDLE